MRCRSNTKSFSEKILLISSDFWLLSDTLIFGLIQYYDVYEIENFVKFVVMCLIFDESNYFARYEIFTEFLMIVKKMLKIIVEGSRSA